MIVRMPIRVAHFSDVHLTVPDLGWEGKDYLSKKATGWVNVKLLGRGHRFRHSDTVVESLVGDLASRNFDAAVFTGDATKLAFPNEFAHAAARLKVGDPAMPRSVAVPGNHDLYNLADVQRGEFERAFAPWLVGTRLTAETFPYAVPVGHCWFVAVNSARSNFWPFDASGKIGGEQLERLTALCASLPPGPRILVTHYPLRKASGRPEAVTRRLRDRNKAARVAADGGISLWLHGHIHAGFHLPANDEIPFPTIGAGSATQTDRWQFNEYTIDGYELTMLKRRYDFEAKQYRDAESATMTLPGA
jgi:3',5'-cyclic AMP phosphodiesterase CpdA